MTKTVILLIKDHLKEKVTKVRKHQSLKHQLLFQGINFYDASFTFMPLDDENEVWLISA